VPEISALTSTYNGTAFVAETIESILNQTFEDFEFIVIDDCSTDNTVDIIKSFNDKRIKLFVLEKNVGVGAALNFGLCKVTGKYLAKVDSDDLYAPDRFQKQKDLLDNNPDVDLVKAFIEYFTTDEKVKQSERYEYRRKVDEVDTNNVVTPEQIREQLYMWCCVTHNSIMARSEVIKSVGYDNLRQGEDYKLVYLINKNGHKMDTVREKLVRFRLRDDSITGLMNDQSILINSVIDMKMDDMAGFLENDKKLFIWGTGNQGQLTAQRLMKEGYGVEGFIERDQEKVGKDLLGIKIFGPEEALGINNKKIMVCAQPIRTMLLNLFRDKGYKYKEDYFVIL
jgi:glycosyltransferase involved in cell wall biosynthesis